jgi:hypothetical protein
MPKTLETSRISVIATLVSMAGSHMPWGNVALDTLQNPGATLKYNNLPSLRIGNGNCNLYLVFGRFPAELGPETRSNGSGSKNGAERTQD